MTVNDTPRPQNAAQDAPVPQAEPVRMPHRGPALARSALVAGGAAAGLLASAVAGFGLVGLIFPHASLPGTGGMALTAAAYAPAPVVVKVIPEPTRASYQPATLDGPVAADEPVATPRQVLVQPLPASTPASTPAAAPGADPLSPMPGAMTRREATGFSAPAAQVAAPGGMPVAAGDRRASAPASEIALETAPRYAPESAQVTRAAPAPVGVLAAGNGPAGASVASEAGDPGLEHRMAVTAPATSTLGPRIAALPARPEAAAMPAPEDFAMLADDDAAARAASGLFAAPQGASRNASADATPDHATASSPEAGAEIAALRPAPRPGGSDAQGLEATQAPAADDAVAMAEPAPSAAPLSSIRPAPRPALRLAAPAPAAAAPAAAPAAPEAAIVKVAARPGSAGFASRGTAGCGKSLARSMPTRRGGATGSAFFAGLAGTWGPDRDARVIAELARGNMPGFLRDLQPVTFRGQDARGQAVEITICVTPDYLALGSDQDYVRVPLGLPAAARIAGAFDMTLPTPRMVDAIYAQASVKLSPAPMTPGSQMQSTAYFLTHNATIEKQLGGRRGLVAGHKKDVVMASRMASAPGRVAIYGWHQSNGAPIQPVSTVHGANYADYSHGIRLVSKTAFLNGKPVSLDDLLASSRYASLLNTDGPMPGPVIRVASN